MAEKRMFTKKITDDDNFISLPSSTQALYFHLNQGADDDGFNNQVSMAMFKAHATTDDLKVLMAKNYIIRFESGVIVIKHWRMHNTLRKDRYQPTNFQEELKMLGIKSNGAYTLGCQVVAEGLPSGCHSIDKDSIEEDSIEESKERKKERKAKGYDAILSAVEDDSLRELYLEYIKMRKLIKSPMTDRALTMLINKVNELEPISIDRQKQLLETAIMNNWKSVYPLKDNQTKQEQGTGNMFVDMLCEMQNGE